MIVKHKQLDVVIISSNPESGAVELKVERNQQNGHIYLVKYGPKGEVNEFLPWQQWGSFEWNERNDLFMAADLVCYAAAITDFETEDEYLESQMLLREFTEQWPSGPQVCW